MPGVGPHFLCLCDEVVLVVWSLSAPADGKRGIVTEARKAIAPLGTLRLALADGGTRIVWAMRRPHEGAAFLANGGPGEARFAFSAQEAGAVDAALFEGVAARSRPALISALLATWASLFRLQRSPSFVHTLRSLFPLPEGTKARLTPMVGVEGATILEATVPQGFGALKSAFHLSAGRLQPLRIEAMSTRAADVPRGVRRFLCAHPQPDRTGLVVLRGEGGFVVREWGAEKAPSLERWWAGSNRRDEGLRQECIGVLSAHSPAGRAAALEFQLRCPLRPKAVAGSSVLPSAQLELALSGNHGTLLSGWYRDPSSFVDGFDLVDDEGKPHPVDIGRYEFAGKIAGKAQAALPATGFIHLARELRSGLLQPRLLMRLKSGVRYLMTPQVQPVEWSEARAAALRAVPPQALTDELIADCLAPVLEEMQQAAKAGVGAASVRRIGEGRERPLCSIVVPLYKVLDFLPFQIAAFASDPGIASSCELIYVLDSPELAETVEHLLTGLYLIYGLPMTLAVMPRNGGFAMSNNRAVALARGEYLALVNSDVVPIEAGWIGQLLARLADGSVGMTGPKLLFEDDSLQHAGLFFARDHRGRWLNHHYYKGMPRHYAPAEIERPVPGVTGACMVLKRSLFEQVGGFTEDYVIGDYEDSDLCLKIRSQGLDIVYVPGAELYHLERRSMRESADYMRGVASQYNSWLHEQRWADVMGHLMHDRFAARTPMRSAA